MTSKNPPPPQRVYRHGPVELPFSDLDALLQREGMAETSASQMREAPDPEGLVALCKRLGADPSSYYSAPDGRRCVALESGNGNLLLVYESLAQKTPASPHGRRILRNVTLSPDLDAVARAVYGRGAGRPGSGLSGAVERALRAELGLDPPTTHKEPTS